MQDPLVPPDVDLRDFAFMPLHVQQLCDSNFTTSVSPEEFRSGVLLWCKAWHQLPAGSLPNDDGQLARLAGYGFAMKDWKRVKKGAMYGWSLASDGRFYHQVVAKVVLNSWESKLKNEHDKLAERLRKANKVAKERNLPETPVPTFEEWKATRMAVGLPPESAPVSAGNADDSAGKSDPNQRNTPSIPPENPLKGSEGKGREGNGKEVQKRGVATPTDTARPGGSHPAIEKIDTSRAKAPPWWDSPSDVAATARTFGVERRHLEDDEAFRDRVWTAVEAKRSADAQDAARRSRAA